METRELLKTSQILLVMRWFFRQIMDIIMEMSWHHMISSLQDVWMEEEQSFFTSHQRETSSRNTKSKYIIFAKCFACLSCSNWGPKGRAWRERRLMRFTPFDGNTCRSQLYFVKIEETSLLFSKKTAMERQLMTALLRISSSPMADIVWPGSQITPLIWRVTVR